MIVKVTQEHINKGKAHSNKSCPIAIAMCGKYFVEEWAIFSEDPLIADGPLCELPECASRFVSDFDNGKPVAPFEFEIDLPE